MLCLNSHEPTTRHRLFIPTDAIEGVASQMTTFKESTVKLLYLLLELSGEILQGNHLSYKNGVSHVYLSYSLWARGIERSKGMIYFFSNTKQKWSLLCHGQSHLCWIFMCSLEEEQRCFSLFFHSQKTYTQKIKRHVWLTIVYSVGFTLVSIDFCVAVFISFAFDF